MHDLRPVCGWQQDRIDQNQRAGAVRIGGREFERDQPAETVPDKDRAAQPQLAASPGQIVGKRSHRVGLLGRVTLAVAPEVHGDHAVILGEMVKLRRPETAMARDAVREQEGGVAATRLLVAERHSLTNHPCHAVSLQERQTEPYAERS